jgi:hypothetical protein
VGGVGNEFSETLASQKTEPWQSKTQWDIFEQPTLGRESLRTHMHWRPLPRTKWQLSMQPLSFEESCRLT